ncbi:MAG: WD40 repeat domain-containing protein [Bacteroidota bacterium]
MKTTPIITLLITCFAFELYGQNLPCQPLDCACILEKVRQLREAGDYQRASDKLAAYRICDPVEVAKADLEAQAILKNQLEQEKGLRRKAEDNARVARRERARANEKATAARLAAARAEAAAMANFNAAKVLETARVDSTLALRMAMKNYELFPEQAITSAFVHGLIGDYHNQFYQTSFAGHSAEISAVAFSPDGQTVLTGSYDGTAKLWNLSGEELQTFPGHGDAISAVAFSPGGDTIATASYDRTARLWSRTGEELQILRGHQGAVYSVTFSPDGQFILTGSRDRMAVVWSQAGKELYRLSGHQGRVYAAVFSPDGQYILTGSDDRTAKLWNTGGELITSLTGHESDIHAVAFSPGGENILTGSRDRTARLWSLEGVELRKYLGHRGSVYAVAFSPDGEQVLTGSEDHTVKLWDKQKGEPQTLSGHRSTVRAVTFSPDNTAILSGSFDHTAKLWQLQGQDIRTFDGHTSDVYAVAFSPDGQNVLTGSRDHTARLRSLAGENLQVFTGHENGIYAAVFSPDGQRVLTGSADHTAKLWQLNGTEVQHFEGHENYIITLTFSPDGQFVLTGSGDQTARLWNLRGEELLRLTGHSGSVFAVAFSPDGQFILTGSADNTVKLWNRRGEEVQTFSGHRGNISAVAFSPDGQYILSGSGDHTAKLWNRAGEELHTFTGHEGYVYAAVFSPDGQFILTGSADHTAKIWSPQGQELQNLRGHNDEVIEVNYSPDGTYILTGSRDRTAKLWKSTRAVINDNVALFPLDQLLEVGFQLPEPEVERVAASGTEQERLALGQYLYNKKKWEKADQVYSQLTTRLGVEVLIQMYEIATRLGKKFTVERFLSLEENQELVQAGNYLFAQKQWQAAQRIYEKVENPRPQVIINSYQIARELGTDFDVRQISNEGLEEVGNYFFAEEEWEMAQQIYERIEQPHARVWARQYEMGQRTDTEFTLRQIPEEDLQSVGDYFFEKEDWKTAAQIYDQIQNPNRDALIRQYELAEKMGSEFANTAFLNLGSDEDLSYIGHYFYERGRLDITMQVYEQVKRPDAKVLINSFEVAQQLGIGFELKRFYLLRDDEQIRIAADFLGEKKEWEVVNRLYERIEKPDAEVLITWYEMALELGGDFPIQRFLDLDQEEELWVAGNYFDERKDWETAQRIYEQFSSSNPETLIRLYEIAQKLGSDFAEKQFLDLEKDKDLKYVGDYFFYEEELELAERIFERIADPGAETVYRTYEITRKKEGEEEAFQQLQRKISSGDDFIRDIANLISSSSSKMTENLSICQLLLKIMPTDRDSLANSTRSALDFAGRRWNTPIYRFINLGKFAEAEIALRCALTIAPEDMYLKSNLPPALLLQGKYAEAEELYRAYKDLPFPEDTRYETLAVGFLEDLQLFEEGGIIPEEHLEALKRIRALLQE